MVFMKGISQGNMVLENQFFNAPKIMSRNAIVARQPNARLQPELALTFGCANVNMCRFSPLVGVKMKPK
jgi:hypothetical protein